MSDYFPESCRGAQTRWPALRTLDRPRKARALSFRATRGEACGDRHRVGIALGLTPQLAHGPGRAPEAMTRCAALEAAAGKLGRRLFDAAPLWRSPESRRVA